jgi:hypothetical protein
LLYSQICRWLGGGITIMCAHTCRSPSTRLTETQRKETGWWGYHFWPPVYRSQINALSSFFFFFFSPTLLLLDKDIYTHIYTHTRLSLGWVERVRLIKPQELVCIYICVSSMSWLELSMLYMIV